MTLVAGVDGGGTHMRAVIVDGAGRELGRAVATGAVVNADDPGPAVRAVSKAVRAAAKTAAVPLPLDRMWAGLAGAGAMEAHLAVARELGAQELAREVVVGTDVEAAFHDAFGEGPGILLIAGTGSIAWARGLSGEVVRVGGWGDRIGDEGSGFAIGKAALRAVARGEDGRGPATALRDRVLEHLGMEAPEQLIAWARAATKAQAAGLVPVVATAAADGDAVAAGILDEAVGALSDHLTAVLARTGPWAEPPELVLWGGLVCEDGSLREAVERAVRAQPVRLSTRSVDPVLGAAGMALMGGGESTRGP